MTLDFTIRIGDVLMAGGFLLGGWRFAFIVRDEMRGLRQTVYGSIEPPVEGLVTIAKRHEKAIGRFAFLDGSNPDDRP